MDFFFQAEDGIRDGTVTGVETCALPISEVLRKDHCREELVHLGIRRRLVAWLDGQVRVVTPNPQRERQLENVLPRSEERRVGKGCRSRRAEDRRTECTRGGERDAVRTWL